MNSLKKYVCTHCGKQFEHEEREIIECPGCYWSSSVKPAEQVASHQPSKSLGKEEPKVKTSGAFVRTLKTFFILILAIGLVLGGVIWGWPHFKSFFNKSKNISVTPEFTVSPEVVSQSSPLQDETGVMQIDENLGLDPILTKKVAVSADRVPSEEEQKILNARVNLKTGLIEKLPSQIWSLEQFEELIKEKEAFYKVPLKKKYKKQIIEFFQKVYLASRDPFASGDILTARNLWVSSLAFPVYQNNIQRHRGVVLTMLRPFINDTLSKVGVANSILVERQIRSGEVQVNQSYQQLFALLEEKKWNEALQHMETLEKDIQNIMQWGGGKKQAPPYPETLGAVDVDICEALLALQQVSSPALSDFGNIKNDLMAKKLVVKSFMPQFVNESIAAYNRAMALIAQQQWVQAKQELQKIRFPKQLQQDAADKIKRIDEIL